MSEDKFTELMTAIESGRLTLRQIEVAIRASIRHRKDIPDGIKDLLAGSDAANPGLICTMFRPIREVIGTVELAYRRGAQKDK